MYSREVTALSIVDETFEKIAKNTTIQGQMPDYDAALRKAGVKNKNNPFKQQAKNTKKAFGTGSRSALKNSVKNFAKSKNIRAAGLIAGLGLAGGSAALGIKKSIEKEAFELTFK